jgi:periplasmic divalent cation tolerance protein
MTDRVVILITCPVADAGGLARALVERRLAACLNILSGVQSVYRWQGEVEEADEALLLVKTVATQVAALDGALQELHRYETYELVVLPVSGGNEAYLQWIGESVAG